MIIRKAKLDDFEDINKIARQVHEMHVEWSPKRYRSTDYPIPNDYFQTLVEKEVMYVAENKTIVGYIGVNIKEKTGIPAAQEYKTLFIDSIGVDELNRGKGIGKTLIDFALELAKENGCTMMDLSVNSQNLNAIKFYESLNMKVRDMTYSLEVK